ncbi:Aldo keto reductase [Mycena albidolilacea]|uniref:Aldo keto reductase n=1 Tax=Mycena albidolilacea TaxID=1033008 RepID=A0AAD7E7N1_9AGAR|nr:Aldo keto reductase [Mycena albidolilacea]
MYAMGSYTAGINAFDTAAVYSDGASEEILGKAIKEYNLPRDEIIVITKVFGYTAWNKPKADESGVRTMSQHGLSRKHIFNSVKHSLKRLQLDYIDLLQCHRFDYETLTEEPMQALHDVVQAGHAKYYAITNKLTSFSSIQNHHSPRDVPHLEGHTRGTGDAYKNLGGAEDIIGRVEMAKKHGVSMTQVVLTWSLGKEVVVHLQLTPEEMKLLEEPYPPEHRIWTHLI